MRIRDITLSDRDEFIRMSNSFYGTSAVLHPVPSDYYEKTFDVIVGGGALSYVRGLIIEENDVTVGFAVLTTFWSCEVGGDCIMLEEIYIKDEYRGFKLGSRFLDWMDAEYKDKVRRIRLEVTKQNNGAALLYQKKGYKYLDYLQMYKD